MDFQTARNTKQRRSSCRTRSELINVWWDIWVWLISKAKSSRKASKWIHSTKIQLALTATQRLIFGLSRQDFCSIKKVIVWPDLIRQAQQRCHLRKQPVCSLIVNIREWNRHIYHFKQRIELSYYSWVSPDRISCIPLQLKRLGWPWQEILNVRNHKVLNWEVCQGILSVFKS